MDHTRFKANHTAALYVSGDLDEHVQETFELHLMSCSSCLQDVEIWRAMSGGIRQQRDVVIERSAPSAQPVPWRIAASFALIAIGSGAVGWFGHTLAGASLDDESIAVFNLPPVTRGGDDCVRLQVAPVTELIALRVPNAALGRQLELTDAEGRLLEANSYSVRTQADGSWLVRVRARQSGEIVRLQTRGADGLSEPLGCFIEAGRS
jgi:anti-sigma factor RsiW